MAERSFADPVKATDAVNTVQTVKPRTDLDTKLLAVVSGVVGATVAIVFETTVIILMMLNGKL